jgi:hypothetical protein
MRGGMFSLDVGARLVCQKRPLFRSTCYDVHQHESKLTCEEISYDVRVVYLATL